MTTFNPTETIERLMHVKQSKADCKNYDDALRTYHEVQLLLSEAPPMELIEQLLTRELQAQRRYSVMKRLYTRYDQLRHREEMTLIDAISLEQGVGRGRL